MASDAPKQIGPYEILGPLGKGAMGAVYKAMQPSLNRIVAIKVLPADFASDPDRIARFHREAQTVAMLSHPNIKVMLNTDYRELEGVIPFQEVIYTGPVDEYFDYIVSIVFPKTRL